MSLVIRKLKLKYSEVFMVKGNRPRAVNYEGQIKFVVKNFITLENSVGTVKKFLTPKF